jgi:hypothetical protein
MPLESTQPLTEISTINIFWEEGKTDWSAGLTILRPSCADVSKSGSLNPARNLKACNRPPQELTHLYTMCEMLCGTSEVVLGQETVK